MATPPEEYPEHVTFTYKEVDSHPILLDVCPPSLPSSSSQTASPMIPALIYFHGGGLIVGDRRSFFPMWLYRKASI